MPSLLHAVATRVVPTVRRSPSPDDVPALRRALAERNRAHPTAPPALLARRRDLERSDEAGFPVWTVRRRGARPTRAVFYLHGGGYVAPSSVFHWRYAVRLADAIGAAVVFPAYPLAPEFTVADSHDALARLFGRVAEAAPDGVLLAGDSAGGGSALALTQTLRDRGAALPDRLLLIAPWVDLTGQAPGTAEAAERDPWLSYPLLSVYARFWAGDGVALTDPRVSPGLGDLTGLPPALMFCGTRDLLQPGCDALFERADAAGWELEYVRADGLIHAYPLLPVPEARDALRHTLRWLRDGEQT